MNDVATKTDLNNSINDLEARMDKRFDELMALLSQFANDVQDKFVEHDQEFANHRREFVKLHQKYDHLIATVDGFVGRIDHYETEQAARDHAINRHKRWIDKIATKTGVKLS